MIAVREIFKEYCSRWEQEFSIDSLLSLAVTEVNEMPIRDLILMRNSSNIISRTTSIHVYIVVGRKVELVIILWPNTKSSIPHSGVISVIRFSIYHKTEVDVEVCSVRTSPFPPTTNGVFFRELVFTPSDIFPSSIRRRPSGTRCNICELVHNSWLRGKSWWDSTNGIE